MNPDTKAVLGARLEELAEQAVEPLIDLLAGRARIVLHHTPIKPTEANGAVFGAFETSVQSGGPFDGL